MLTNPVYAGRIRHKKETYDGQHPAIIAPEVWDEVQRRLIERAARPRGVASSGSKSPLAGKVIDETGDQLSPSHSRKNGRRLRYYISRRLVTDGAGKHPDAWRLPAPQLEQAILRAIKDRLQHPALITEIVTNIEARETARLNKAIGAIAAKLTGPAAVSKLRALVSQARIALGRITIALDAETIATHLNIPQDRIAADALTVNAPFTIRRRGVETKIILGHVEPEIDKVLIRNIVTAQRWFLAVRRGSTFSEIAAREGVWKQRVQQMIGLAFLAPDIIEAIAEGRQPIGLTTEWLRHNPLPANWSDQRRLIDGL